VYVWTLKKNWFLICLGTYRVTNVYLIVINAPSATDYLGTSHGPTNMLLYVIRVNRMKIEIILYFLIGMQEIKIEDTFFGGLIIPIDNEFKKVRAFTDGKKEYFVANNIYKYVDTGNATNKVSFYSCFTNSEKIQKKCKGMKSSITNLLKYAGMIKIFYKYDKPGCIFIQIYTNWLFKFALSPVNSLYKNFKSEENIISIPVKMHYGWVYFIRELGSESKFKIGYTDRNPQNRLLNLQGVGLRSLELYKYIVCKDPMIFKAHLHDVYNEKHIRGEWFDLNESEVDELVEFLEGKPPETIK
jgi:hypothetical protein